MINIVLKPWGREEIWALTDMYVGKILYIESGERLSLQHHERKDETILVMSGILEFSYSDSIEDELKTIILKRGERFHIPPGMIHRMTALSYCEVCEVSTNYLADVVRHEDDYGRIL